MGLSKNYRAALKAPSPGKGGPEVSLVLIYDVEDDRLRTHIAEICLDYGLERIQFSAFFGKLNRNRRQELALRLMREVEQASARIRIYPICEADLKDAWTLEQYRRDADELKAEPGRRDQVVLKVVGPDE